MKSGKLDPFKFGRQLVTTLDLDPVYVVLWNSPLCQPVEPWAGPYTLRQHRLAQWLMAYWCFYHMGTASWIVDQPDYWTALRTAAGSSDYPRGTERRHFRGDAALQSVTYLEERGLYRLLAPLRRPNAIYSLGYVMQVVQGWRGFGPWIAFKVADMLERLGLVSIVFAPEDVFRMFDAPLKGAELMADLHGPARGEVYRWALDKLLSKLSDLKAPPRHDRPLNVQEVETILCKWKSHMGGHYEVGKDTTEIEHALTHCSWKSQTAANLGAAGVTGGMW